MVVPAGAGIAPFPRRGNGEVIAIEFIGQRLPAVKVNQGGGVEIAVNVNM